jgi:zinc protease
MRRSLAAIAVVGVVAVACSGRDETGSTDPTTTVGSTAVPSAGDDAADAEVDDGADTADEIATADGADSGPQDQSDDPGEPVWERPDGPELPGLLDVTDDEIPNDADVRTGTLENGLRYYVRFNDNPGGKAELRLAIKAGSVDEAGTSTGVAHFLEHMLFNGTEQFPENDLIDVLRSFGAAFGADINAYTSFDETVYQLTVPNADETVALGLTVLEEWLSKATIVDDEVVAERGVVLDEWRIRTQSTSGRLFEVAADLFLADTPYEGRAPIGDDASIEAMPQAELRAFYDDWYRPDNAAIVVVGDIDVDEIVTDIERIFGPAMPRSDAMPARPSTRFVAETEPDFGLHVDPDQQTVDVEVTLPLPDVGGAGTAAYRTALLDLMIYDALVRRLEGAVAAGTTPFDRISPGGNSFVDPLDAPALYAFTDADRVRETLVALLDEYERAFRHGFDPAETDLAVATIRSAYEVRFEGRESTQDRVYADQYVDNFLRGERFPSIEDEHTIATALLDAVTPDALAERFRARWANSAPHVIISTPESDADAMPARDEVLRIIAETATRDVAPRSERRELPDVLMARPTPVELTGTRNLVRQGDFLFDPVEMVFPNGVTVIVNSNPIVEGRVFLQAASPGGSSLVDDADVVDALYAAEVVRTGGVADFNQAEVDEILAGQEVELNARITPYREHFDGAAATADLESLFQLIHLSMTDPRFDEVALGQTRRQEQPLVDDPGSDPAIAGDDALVDVRYGGELRYTVIPDAADFASLDLAGIERVWTDLYGDADDWVFVFVGDADVDTIFELAAAYLGTLPSSGNAEMPIDVEDPPPDDIARVTVEAGTGDTASVVLLFTSPIDDITARLRATKDVTTNLLSARLTDVIREQLGESYSPFVFSQIVTDPDPVIETYVRVTGSPDRVEAIADLVVGQFTDIATNGVPDDEFANAFAQVEEAYGFINNFQIGHEVLEDAVDPFRELDDYLFEFAELPNVTERRVQLFVVEHLPSDQYVQVTVRPR